SMLIPAEVVRLDCERSADGNPFALQLADGRAVQSHAVVIATGALYRRPDCANLKAMEGRGVWYWASPIEAKMCAGQEVVLVGGGNSAGQAAVFLSAHASKVWMLVRGAGLAASMSKYLIDRITATANIELLTRTEIVARGLRRRPRRQGVRDDRLQSAHAACDERAGRIRDRRRARGLRQARGRRDRRRRQRRRADPFADPDLTAMTERCPWSGSDPLYVDYHDKEWGVPVHDDRMLFEFLILEGMQAGLSWTTILKKRDNYRNAFNGFRPEKIARYGARDVKRLLGDAGIVRNRLKIAATIENAKTFLAVRKEFETFDVYLWSFVGG